ncbi:hypothetical protein [Streptomyces melanosporofaciens]|uniref:Uncharacterized protein n=1 Tax=Streptomyces melanosporofaciens TaxID=67327 RepID=A0A1H4KKN5_STRMJ|nr:hypothetical protein [Streptomyces melanosporofaciens]SEB58963.1 hypothetical protein SAMN04490356_0792 [Streptomyces melanosporofaciens]
MSDAVADAPYHARQQFQINPSPRLDRWLPAAVIPLAAAFMATATRTTGHSLTDLAR